MGGSCRVPARCVCVVALVLGPMMVPAQAAAGCFYGTRPPTIAERSFHVETLKALKAAMPALPQGWRLIEETEVRAPRIACIGQEREPLTLEYQVHLRRAAAVGNERGSADGAPEEVAASDAEIVVEVNPRATALGGAVEVLTLPGATLALRRGSGTSSVVHLLLGDWSLDSEDSTRPSGGRADAHLVADTPSTTVQALAVRITGDVAGAEALARQIKLDALNAILYR